MPRKAPPILALRMAAPSTRAHPSTLGVQLSSSRPSSMADRSVRASAGGRVSEHSQEFLFQSEVAYVLAISPVALKRWRNQGCGPKWKTTSTLAFRLQGWYGLAVISRAQSTKQHRQVSRENC